MENRRKFYGLSRMGKPIISPSNWSNDTIDDRYDHINKVLSVHPIMDAEDLKFIVKNAFISRIYISVEAERLLRGKMLGSLHGLYSQLISDHVLDLQDGRFGSILSPYFDICKLGDKGLGISIEHVVPGEVYIKDALAVKSFTKTYFKTIFDKVYICLVTSAQAKDLDKFYKSSLPVDPKTGVQYDYKIYPFARYDKSLGGVGIDVY